MRNLDLPRPTGPTLFPTGSLQAAPLFALLLVAVLLSGPGCTSRQPDTLLVYAAASMIDAVEEAAAGFNGQVQVKPGGTGQLALEIERGAPADVLIAAHPEWIAHLTEEGHLIGDPIPLARNRLVIVVPAGVESAPGDALIDARRFAMGDPGTVPAGRYAREALIFLGLWDDVAPRRVESPDVRAALALVENGSVDAGIVYASDAARSRKVTVASILPEESHSPIVILGAVTRRARHPEAAGRFLDYLAGPSGQEILHRHGFEPGALEQSPQGDTP